MNLNQVVVANETYYVSQQRVAFYQVFEFMQTSPLKLISHRVWPNLPGLAFGVTGAIWTATRISCPVQVVWVVAADGSGAIDRWDKTFNAWAVLK